MKKLLFVTAFVAAAFVVEAQKGNWYIGGVGGYSTNTDKSPGGVNTTTSSWAFGPEVGTFLQDDIQLGLVLSVAGSSEKDDTNQQESSSSFNPTVYGRKFFKLTDNFATFVGLYVHYSSGTDKDFLPAPTQEITTTGFGINLGAGVAFVLSPRFTAVGQYGVLGYQSESTKVDGVDAGSNSSFGFGVNTVGTAVFNIGIYYTLMKK